MQGSIGDSKPPFVACNSHVCKPVVDFNCHYADSIERYHMMPRLPISHCLHFGMPMLGPLSAWHHADLVCSMRMHISSLADAVRHNPRLSSKLARIRQLTEETSGSSPSCTSCRIAPNSQLLRLKMRHTSLYTSMVNTRWKIVWYVVPKVHFNLPEYGAARFYHTAEGPEGPTTGHDPRDGHGSASCRASGESYHLQDTLPEPWSCLIMSYSRGAQCQQIIMIRKPMGKDFKQAATEEMFELAGQSLLSLRAV